MQAAQRHFEEASVVAVEQQDRQLETMACTALGLLLTSSHFPDLQDQQMGWKRLQRYHTKACLTVHAVPATIVHQDCCLRMLQLLNLSLSLLLDADRHCL